MYTYNRCVWHVLRQSTCKVRYAPSLTAAAAVVSIGRHGCTWVWHTILMRLFSVSLSLCLSIHLHLPRATSGHRQPSLKADRQCHAFNKMIARTHCSISCCDVHTKWSPLQLALSSINIDAATIAIRTYVHRSSKILKKISATNNISLY